MSATNLKKYSKEEWDFLRKRFYNSILNETEVAKLGQNVGISWPFKGKGETPAKYIDFSFEELQEVPGLIGKKSRIKVLMNIMRETLAFDDPFGDMMANVEDESEQDDTFKRILEKLNVPADYPVDFLHFSKDTFDLLKNEDVYTLIECVNFGQSLASSVMIGGDLKTFLNSLAHRDERIIAKYIPYRRGERGLHLAEAIGLVCEDLDAPTKLNLLQSRGVTLSEEEEQQVSSSSKLKVEATIKTSLEKLSKLAEWFSEEASDLEQAFTTGGSPERFFISINEPRRERIAVELSRLHFSPEGEKKSGFLGRIFGR